MEQQRKPPIPEKIEIIRDNSAQDRRFLAEQVELAAAQDPRFRNPDEFLAKVARSKEAITPTQSLKSEVDKTCRIAESDEFIFGQPALHELKAQLTEQAASQPQAPAPEAEPLILETGRTKAMAQENVNLQIKHEAEIAKWLEYSQNVKLWQAQMIDMVQRMRKEIGALNEIIRLKDKEISDAKVSEKRMTSWLKTGTKVPN